MDGPDKIKNLQLDPGLTDIITLSSIKIENDDTNVDNEKELSLEQKLELAITKQFQQTKIQYKNELYRKPCDEKSIYLKIRDLEINIWKKSILRIFFANSTTPTSVDVEREFLTVGQALGNMGNIPFSICAGVSQDSASGLAYLLRVCRDSMSSHWCDVVVRRGQLRCHSRHLTMAQNEEVRRPKLSGSFIVLRSLGSITPKVSSGF
ncbi:UNVERIFIED_CONTAM: hypothetical protein NCL1_21045 [Trichonephila clavipes]